MVKKFESLENETWKVIPGHETYQVSDLGRFKRTHGNRCTEEHLLTPCPNKLGYLQVVIDGKSYNAHILVAKAFVDGWEPGLEVNHKDENKANNKAENLEWVTHQYNMNYGTRLEKVALSKAKTVMCIETGETYFSAKELSRQLGICYDALMKHLKGLTKTCCGKHWKYIS